MGRCGADGHTGPVLVVSWVAMLVACVGYGVASVLQSEGAKRPAEKVGDTIKIGSIAAIVTQLPYLIGLGLDGVAFVANVISLQRLPLYLVQAVVNASVGVTALVAWRRGSVIHRTQWFALAALGVGLTLLAVSSGAQSATPVGRPLQFLILGFGLVPLGVAVVGLRMRGRLAPVVLAASAGLAFTGVAVASRALVIPDPWYHVVGSPLLWTIIAHGALGVLVFAVALQRGAVTAVTAITFVIELVVPTVIGLTLLGDSVPRTLAPLAGLGFLLTLAATVALAGFAES